MKGVPGPARPAFPPARRTAAWSPSRRGPRTPGPPPASRVASRPADPRAQVTAALEPLVLCTVALCTVQWLSMLTCWMQTIDDCYGSVLETMGSSLDMAGSPAKTFPCQTVGLVDHCWTWLVWLGGGLVRWWGGGMVGWWTGKVVDSRTDCRAGRGDPSACGLDLPAATAGFLPQLQSGAALITVHTVLTNNLDPPSPFYRKVKLPLFATAAHLTGGVCFRRRDSQCGDW